MGLGFGPKDYGLENLNYNFIWNNCTNSQLLGSINYWKIFGYNHYNKLNYFFVVIVCIFTDCSYSLSCFFCMTRGFI